LFGRTGGAATLAVGMAQIFARAVKDRWLDLWYHFAIMFEALFILTTLDAGTRVGRYLLQDVLGHLWKPLGDTRSMKANLLASSLIVSAWGYFLIQGVRDPYGGINSLWPLFGIANQMLAAIALCLSTTIVLKMQLAKSPPLQGAATASARPSLALITLIPLVWLLAVTFTAGIQKIGHSDPRIGFLAQAQQLAREQPGLRQAIANAREVGDSAALLAAETKLEINRTVRFIKQLDALVAGAFLLMVGTIVVLSVREWVRLLQGKRSAALRESPAIELPEYAVVEDKPIPVAAALGLALALAKELTAEGQTERARNEAIVCECDALRPEGGSSGEVSGRSAHVRAYLETTERRYNGVTRCC
jgi:carbon starvation protein